MDRNSRKLILAIKDTIKEYEYGGFSGYLHHYLSYYLSKDYPNLSPYCIYRKINKFMLWLSDPSRMTLSEMMEHEKKILICFKAQLDYLLLRSFEEKFNPISTNRVDISYTSTTSLLEYNNPSDIFNYFIQSEFITTDDYGTEIKISLSKKMKDTDFKGEKVLRIIYISVSDFIKKEDVDSSTISDYFQGVVDRLVLSVKENSQIFKIESSF